MDRRDIMQRLEELLTGFNTKYSSSIEALIVNAEKMKVACDRIKESWSGSCIGYHSKLYYGEFEKPPRGEYFSVEWGGINGLSEAWRERTTEEVKTAIEQLVGNEFKVSLFEKDIENLAQETEDFETNVELFISSIVGKDSTHPLSELEKVEPKKKRKDYILNSIPQKALTRDTEAVAQGKRVPAIIYYEAVVFEAEYLVTSIRQFLKGCQHFIKWYELQGSTDANSGTRFPFKDLSLLHPDICSKCQRLFETGAYPEAVEKNFKVVRDKLRSLTGHETGSLEFVLIVYKCTSR